MCGGEGMHYLAVWSTLSLVPRLVRGRRKKKSGTHCLRMLRISGNLEISCITCSITLTSARHTDFSHIKDAATDYALCGQ